MSLINDALKKAQKQRTGEAPILASLPSVGGQSAASISRRSKSGGPNPLLVWAGAGAGVLLLAVGSWFALRSTPEDRAQKTENSPRQPASTQSSVVSNQSSGPSTVYRPPATETPAPVSFVLPIAQPPKVETVAGVQKNADKEPRTTVAQAPTSSPVAKPPDEPRHSTASAGGPSSDTSAAATQPALKLENRAVQFIDNIKVAGIRASATDAKVLMNDRVYRLGSVVEADLGLKLVGITANSLTFEDERGARYTRIL